MNTRKLTLHSMLIAIGVLSSHIISIPVGVSRCFPIQHFINIIGAIFLGPIGAMCNAFCISLLRNLLGVGSILAFPGSMIGAFLAGVLYKYTKKNIFAFAGEFIGTGLIGGTLAGFIANLFMNTSYTIFALAIPFSLSSGAGVIIAACMLSSFYWIKVVNKK